MNAQQTIPLETAALKARLQELRLERAFATLAGLDDNRAYMDDLTDETVATESAYVGAAVTAIASLRASLDGPLVG